MSALASVWGDMPEDMVFMAAVVLILVGLLVALRGRHNAGRGGITPRSMAGRRRTGAEGPSRVSDREKVDELLDQRGKS